MAFELPTLSYQTTSIEPLIDSETMEIHHGKHHATYVTNLNKALESAPQFQNTSIEELLMNINDIPENIRTAVRNNGGGHANHSMFWKTLKINNGEKPTGELLKAINASFGSYEDFTAKFNDAGLKQFGSGWVFLTADSKTGTLEVISKPNQDTPLMDKKQAVIGNDVWEHAYYLKYRNRRADYLNAWWGAVNWNYASERLEKIMCGQIAE